MFRLSNKADYGLILLSNLAKSGRITSISAIARKNQISVKFLSQIAQTLKKAGIISSKEGVSGGYILAKKPSQIMLLEVLEILDGDIFKGECFDEKHDCHCGGKDMFVAMRKEIQDSMSKKTIADLVI